MGDASCEAVMHGRGAVKLCCTLSSFIAAPVKSRWGRCSKLTVRSTALDPPGAVTLRCRQSSPATTALPVWKPYLPLAHLARGLVHALPTLMLSTFPSAVAEDGSDSKQHVNHKLLSLIRMCRTGMRTSRKVARRELGWVWWYAEEEDDEEDTAKHSEPHRQIQNRDSRPGLRQGTRCPRRT